MSSKKYVGLELPSVVGVGAVGSTLSVVTATLFAAFSSMAGWPDYAYPLLMFVLSAMVAVFPVSQSGYKLSLKLAAWPVAALVIFASAWGSNSGMSAGEEAMGRTEPSKTAGGLFVAAAYADETNAHVRYSEIDPTSRWCNANTNWCVFTNRGMSTNEVVTAQKKRFFRRF